MVSRLATRMVGTANRNESMLRLMDAMEDDSPLDANADVRGMLENAETGAVPRPACAFEHCARGWSRLWKRRARPVFEAAYGCSKVCVRGLVDVAVRREREGAPQEDTEAHQHRVPLGLVLLAQGLVTQTQLRMALEAQRFAGHGRIGHWLVEAAGVSETRVTRGLGMQWQCPVLDLGGFDAPRMALAMPSALRNMCRALPLRLAGDAILYLGFDERVDAAAAFALQRMSGITVESGVLSGMEFARGMEKLEGLRIVSCREEDMADQDAMVDRITETLLKLQPVASRMVRLRDRYWLRLWLEPASFSRKGTLPVSGEDVVDVLYCLKG